MDRHPSHDREYLESQILSGKEVYVNGVIYNRLNLASMPTQSELDTAVGYRGEDEEPEGKKPEGKKPEGKKPEGK